ncbi:FHA domain-containing protein [Rhizobium sp. P40RR-XXII]|uniref:type VI secretion system-associated FHA domain protein n=1 Tax=unclassified Rhizobium TaxID=2613769 RepID=UPI001456DE16|nr:MULTISPECIES: FHA domain-containing protein [unclassified Rhizobium]NLR89261.1 FHA domain-containing protein [Rhizobium sp. P28RR-XV]NLS20123.1 FHA domain-containing protein [Rhizobium sp. P40RR-XXII]
MRLELRQVSGEGASKGWFFERGKRTLGRSPDCDWQVSDPDRLISKVHCVIERDRVGFLLRDQSANGTHVDGAAILEGETARLSDKSRITFGDVTFNVVITGEADRDIDDPAADLRLSDETMTISSILADIAPGGSTATGVLGQRGGDDWIASVPQSSKKSKSSSRNVDIGWNGPPDIAGIKPTLPDDWNSEFELGSQLEHGPATHVSVAVARSTGRDATETAKTIVPANDIRTMDEADQGTDDTSLTLQFDPLRQLEALVDTLEQTLDDEASIFGVENDSAHSSASLFSRERTDQLAERLRSLISRQSALNAGLENLVREASRIFEPRMIEAQVDASPRKALWRGSRDYWKSYRSRFEKDGKSISVRDLLAEAFQAATDGRDEQHNSSFLERTGNTR